MDNLSNIKLQVFSSCIIIVTAKYVSCNHQDCLLKILKNGNQKFESSRLHRQDYGKSSKLEFFAFSLTSSAFCVFSTFKNIIRPCQKLTERSHNSSQKMERWIVFEHTGRFTYFGKIKSCKLDDCRRTNFKRLMCFKITSLRRYRNVLIKKRLNGRFNVA